MINEYLSMCTSIFKGFGVIFNDAEIKHLRQVLKTELDTAFAASSRSEIVVTYECPIGLTVNYHVKAQWHGIDAEYEKWLSTRKPPLFGVEPDARVWDLALKAQIPEHFPILDIGAGTGRNSLPLARRGHAVDAIEMTAKFAQILMDEAKSERLPVRVLQNDIFDAIDELRKDYQLVILSEVVPDFRTVDQLRRVCTLAADSLAKNGHFVLNTFLPKDGYIPDDVARELGQQFYSAILTRLELATALYGLPLELESDLSAYEYEKSHLPAVSWPPTSWYEEWACGQDVFDVPREDSPIELRWLTFRQTE
jgi:2-polyprenyl-3-methyl-5-hydroxy-6-metoxy-1,4-benzoquinol methylase